MKKLFLSALTISSLCAADLPVGLRDAQVQDLKNMGMQHFGNENHFQIDREDPMFDGQYNQIKQELANRNLINGQRQELGQISMELYGNNDHYGNVADANLSAILNQAKQELANMKNAQN
jgi:hypothetical protein